MFTAMMSTGCWYLLFKFLLLFLPLFLMFTAMMPTGRFVVDVLVVVVLFLALFLILTAMVLTCSASIGDGMMTCNYWRRYDRLNNDL